MLLRKQRGDLIAIDRVIGAIGLGQARGVIRSNAALTSSQVRVLAACAAGPTSGSSMAPAPSLFSSDAICFCRHAHSFATILSNLASSLWLTAAAGAANIGQGSEVRARSATLARQT
jgi:hypothetical protein